MGLIPEITMKEVAPEAFEPSPVMFQTLTNLFPLSGL